MHYTASAYYRNSTCNIHVNFITGKTNAINSVYYLQKLAILAALSELDHSNPYSRELFDISGSSLSDSSGENEGNKDINKQQVKYCQHKNVTYVTL